MIVLYLRSNSIEVFTLLLRKYGIVFVRAMVGPGRQHRSEAWGLSDSRNPLKQSIPQLSVSRSGLNILDSC